MSLLLAAIFAAQSLPAEPQPITGDPAIPANPAPLATVRPEPIAADCCVIKAMTPVRLAIVAPMSSDSVAPGQQFAFALSEPILLAGGRAVPAGTPGMGEVVHASRSGMAGKAGELLLAARYLDYEGVRIPLRSMRFGGVGKDQTGTANAVAFGAAVVAPLAGVFALAITGGEVRISAGTIATAKTSADTRLDPARLAAPITNPPSDTHSTNEGIVQ